MRPSVGVVALMVLAAIAGCMAMPAAADRGAAQAALAVALGVTVMLVGVALREALRHRAIAAGLAHLAQPGQLAGHPVGLIFGLDGAVVAGLREPLIYCGHDLPDRLDGDELRAVILHERHHQLHGAPTRLVLLAAAAPFVGPWRRGRVWLECERARIEIAADAYAMSLGVSRPALASAIVKLSAAPLSAGLAGFATAADRRISALVGEATGLEDDRSAAVRAALVGLAVIGACFAPYFR